MPAGSMETIFNHLAQESIQDLFVLAVIVTFCCGLYWILGNKTVPDKLPRSPKGWQASLTAIRETGKQIPKDARNDNWNSRPRRNYLKWRAETEGR